MNRWGDTALEPSFKLSGYIFPQFPSQLVSAAFSKRRWKSDLLIAALLLSQQGVCQWTHSVSTSLHLASNKGGVWIIQSLVLYSLLKQESSCYLLIYCHNRHFIERNRPKTHKNWPIRGSFQLDLRNQDPLWSDPGAELAHGHLLTRLWSMGSSNKKIHGVTSHWAQHLQGKALGLGALVHLCA